MNPETAMNETLLCDHLHGIIYRLRRLAPSHWDFTFAPPAPTPRTLAAHTWQWLICDRHHIEEADAAKHSRIPDPPSDPQALCVALAAETQNWHALLRSLTPERLAEVRYQFNEPRAKMSVREFVAHALQNTVYKHGQLATIYFALGYDGSEPYSAPLPNPIYTERFGGRT